MSEETMSLYPNVSSDTVAVKESIAEKCSHLTGMAVMAQKMADSKDLSPEEAGAAFGLMAETLSSISGEIRALTNMIRV